MAGASETVKVEEKPAASSCDEGLLPQSKMVTASASSVKKAAFRAENSGAAKTAKTNFFYVDTSSEVEEAAWSSPEEPSAAQRVAASISDHLAKRQRRAERFGLNLQVTEAERRQIRAVRFGPLTAGDIVKRGKGHQFFPTTEQQKRKARADRFGSEVSEEDLFHVSEAKKRARAARFGLQVDSHVVKIIARAARFGSSAPIQITEACRQS